jgi:acylphosphatase
MAAHPGVEVAMAQNDRTVRVRITGRVQGVNFRAWAQAEAVRLDLKGWIRNEDDGSVAALISGMHEEVEKMIQRLHKGPLAAAVDRVAVEPAEPADVPKGFRILR